MIETDFCYQCGAETVKPLFEGLCGDCHADNYKALNQKIIADVVDLATTNYLLGYKAGKKRAIIEGLIALAVIYFIIVSIGMVSKW